MALVTPGLAARAVSDPTTRWRIFGKGGKELVLRRSVLTETVSGPGFVSLVAAMNRALDALGGEVALEVQSLAAKRSATKPKP